MNLDELKGKTLDDATHAKLVEFVQGLEGARDAARAESITHRKGLKAKVEELERVNRDAFDKLGIDSAEELAALPDGKGQGEKVTQLEAQLKRLTREIGEKDNALKSLTVERNTERRRSAISSVVAKHQFIDSDVATMLLEHGTELDGDQFMFKADGGKLVPLDEGAAYIAKTKPHLVKAQGGAGSGYRGNGNGNGATPKTMTRAEFDALSHADRMAASLAKTVITD